jgi:hypothetical protein
MLPDRPDPDDYATAGEVVATLCFVLIILGLLLL